MTHFAASRATLNGQDIGQAEHATGPCWTGCRPDGTQFRGWVILNLLAAGGGQLGEDELTGLDHRRSQDRPERLPGAAGLAAGADQP